MGLITFREWRDSKNPRTQKQGFVGGNPRFNRKGIHGDATSLSKDGTRPENKLNARKEIEQGVEDHEEEDE